MIVACLGDSNTRFGTPPGGFLNAGPGTTDVWPEYAPTETGGNAHTWLNFALGAGTVIHPFFWSAIQQLERAVLATPDVIIAAFGTNDFRSLSASRDDTIAGYCRLINDAAPIPVITCLMPDCTDTVGASDFATALNSRMQAIARIGGWYEPIDFYTDSMAALTDGVHLSDAHQHVRAQRVIAAVNAL